MSQELKKFVAATQYLQIRCVFGQENVKRVNRVTVKDLLYYHKSIPKGNRNFRY